MENAQSTTIDQTYADATIAVVLPTRGTVLTKTIMSALIALDGLRYSLITTEDKPIPENENYLVDEALKMNPTHILFLNDDIVLTREAVTAMLEKYADIAFCPYKLGPNQWDYDTWKDEITHCGLGCVLIKADVFKKLKKPYFRTDISYVRFGDEVQEIKTPNQEWGGEDAYFFHKVREAGYKLTKTDVTVQHLGIKDWGDKFNNGGVHRIYDRGGETKRIVAVVHGYPGYLNAGAEHYLHNLLKYLSTNHDVRVYLPTDEHVEYTLDGVKVSSDKRMLDGAQVIITHLDKFRLAEDIAFDKGIPLVHILHNDQMPQYIEKADLVIYNTNWIYEKCHDTIAKLWSEEAVLHPVVNEQPKSSGEYVTTINLFEIKNPDFFYKIVEAMPDTKFLAVKGGYGEQDIREYPNLTIWDNQDDISKVYAATKILLAPSLYESYGMCATEAMTAGIPVIASSTPGLKEALGDYGIFPEMTTEAWVEAIKSDPKREPTKPRFNANKELNKIEEIIKCL